MAKLTAGTNEEGVILDHVQAANRQNQKKISAGRRPGIDLRLQAYSKSLHHDFPKIDRGVGMADVLPVEFRNREAELARVKLGVDISATEEQVGAMQGHAETDAQRSGCD